MMSEELDIMYCIYCGVEGDEEEISSDDWWWVTHADVMCWRCERNLPKDDREKILKDYK
jgi:hypothetical protein